MKSRKPADGRSKSAFSNITRRSFLGRTGIALGAAGLGSAFPSPFVSRALAASKQLKIIQWSHFVPAYDTWMDHFVKEWGEKNGVKATIDHIPHLELPARAAAEIAAQSGHDIFGINGSGGPHLYAKHLMDMSKLVAAVEKKYGKVSPMGRQIAYDYATGEWNAFPDYYIRFPGLYRKDLWDEIGMVPDTWEDIRKGGAKLKKKGHPIGIGMAHSNDPNVSYRGILWSYGGAVTDKSGKRVVLNSKATIEAVKFTVALYKEAMDPEVLSWDDAGNNRFLGSGKGSWIHNPISAYRSAQKSNPALADKIHLWKTPAGPVTRLTSGAPNSYVVWKFAKNKDEATQFLLDYAANWVDAFKASTGYNHPLYENIVPKPMPILSNDPTSHPADKLKVLETANEWHAVFGYPGPAGPASDEVATNFIIPDMMAKAATGRASPEEAVKWAEKACKHVYEKWPS
jgi:multiple sugar transport system substrate-binding protein